MEVGSIQRSGVAGRTNEVDEGDAADEEGDDDVAKHARDRHGQESHHGQDRVLAEIVLVVQLRRTPPIPFSTST